MLLKRRGRARAILERGRRGCIRVRIRAEAAGLRLLHVEARREHPELVLRLSYLVVLGLGLPYSMWERVESTPS